ncbi:MAG TPA: class A beta-lactamase [Caulobacteraceae bacterium]|nr:class A beta-lactamase [Caulobacteraceae bacterium]
MRPSRRDLIAGAAASLCAAEAFATDRLGAIEAKTGGRLGVAALDLTSGRRLQRRADERFPMCSTFKAMAVAALLQRVDRGEERLDRFVRYRPSDVLPYAPVARIHAAEGGMRLGDLCAAALQYSDNTAANLVLGAIGWTRGWTRFVRSLGDPVSELDRIEPALNTAAPADVRDTTTPAAMLADLKAVGLGAALAPASRERIVDWMTGCQTGLHRLRAGLPAAWRVADKTGTGAHGSSNDIAIAFAPGGPIVISCYLTGAERVGDAERDAAHAAVARVVAETFRPGAAHG